MRVDAGGTVIRPFDSASSGSLRCARSGYGPSLYYRAAEACCFEKIPRGMCEQLLVAAEIPSDRRPSAASSQAGWPGRMNRRFTPMNADSRKAFGPRGAPLMPPSLPSSNRRPSASIGGCILWLRPSGRAVISVVNSGRYPLIAPAVIPRTNHSDKNR